MKVHIPPIGWVDVKMIKDLVSVKIPPTEERTDVSVVYNFEKQMPGNKNIIEGLREILSPPNNN